MYTNQTPSAPTRTTFIEPCVVHKLRRSVDASTTEKKGTREVEQGRTSANRNVRGTGSDHRAAASAQSACDDRSARKAGRRLIYRVEAPPNPHAGLAQATITREGSGTARCQKLQRGTAHRLSHLRALPEKGIAWLSTSRPPPRRCPRPGAPTLYGDRSVIWSPFVAGGGCCSGDCQRIGSNLDPTPLRRPLNNNLWSEPQLNRTELINIICSSLLIHSILVRPKAMYTTFKCP